MCGSNNAANSMNGNAGMNNGGCNVTNVPQMSSPKSASRKVGNPQMNHQHNSRNVYPGQNAPQVS